jgi:hypothetical protein
MRHFQLGRHNPKVRIKRRKFLRLFALALTSWPCKELIPAATLAEHQLSIKPYSWEGPYSEMRNKGAKHDWRLCAEVRAPWMGKGERLIIRSSEIVGYETGFLYDDHFPPSEPDGRGKDYRHIPFQWKQPRNDRVLSTDCLVPGKGKFSLTLSAQRDSVDIRLSLRNDLPVAMGEIDWAFCIVAMESPLFADSTRDRTYLFDGRRLRTFAELSHGPKMELFKVKHGRGFVPVGHKMLPVNPVEAKAPIVIVESPDRRYVTALGFERAYTIYGDPRGNKCFHADPYFGPFTRTHEERSIHGRLYVTEGTAQTIFARFNQEFAGGQ